MLQSAVKQYDIRGIVGKHFTCHDVYAYTKAFLIGTGARKNSPAEIKAVLR